MTALVAALTGLVVYRLTLLVVADVITEPIRDRLVQRWTVIVHRPVEYVSTSTGEWRSWECSCGETWSDAEHPTDNLGGRYWYDQHYRDAPKERDSKLATLITCPWCASMWLAGPVVASAIWWGDGRGWLLAAGTLAASAVTGFLATFASPD